MKITIARKIAFSFLVILILFIGMSYINYQGFKKVSGSLDNLELETMKRGSAENLRFSITQLLMPANDFIITGYQHYKSDFHSLNDIVNKNLYKFQQFPLTKDEKQLVVQIKNDLDSIRSYSEQIFLIPEPRQSLKAVQLMETMDYRFGEEVNKKTIQIFDRISKRVEEHRRQAVAEKENVMKLIFGITFIGILISIVFSFLTVRRISKPIITIAKAADNLANGDYSHRCVVKTHDEIELLAKSFNQMSESIQQSHKVLKESKRLTEAIVKTVPIGLLVFDHSGKILSANSSFCNFFGLSQNLLLSQNIIPIFEKLVIPEESRINILAFKTVSDLECNYSDPAKGTRVMNLTLFPIPLTEGESLLMLEDITKRKHDEQVVSNSEKHYRALIENSNDGLFVVSPDGFLIYESPANSHIIGFAHNELLNRNISEFVHPDDLPSVTDQLKELLRQPDSIKSAEFRIQHKDGTWRWIDVTAKNSLHNITIGGIVINFRDITGRKLVEESLKESEQKYRSLVDSMNEGLGVLNKNGIFIFINKCGCDMLGYQPEELIGKPITFIFDEENQKIIREQLAQRREGVSHNYEATCLRKDGSEMDLIIAPNVCVDEKGNFVESLAVFTDITERKRAEQELLRIGTAIEQTADWVVITDKDGTIQYINPAFTKISGFSKEEALGKTPRILKSGHHPPPPKIYETLWETILRGEIFSTTFTNKRKDGKLIYEYETITPIKDKEGNITHFVSTGKEITEQRRAEEALKESEERFRSIYENSTIGLYRTTPDGEIILANPALVKLLGYSSFEELAIRNLEKEGFERTYERKLFLEQIEKNGKVIGLESAWNRKDGLVIYVRESARAYHDSNGKALYYDGTVEDITEHKHAEEEIISQKNRFAQLFDNSPIAIASLDDQDKIAFINEAFSNLFGYYLEEIKGKSINDLIVPNELKEEAKRYLDQTHEGSQINKESYRRRKDGNLVYVQIVGVPVIINEKTVGVYKMYMDLTQRKISEEELINAKEKAEEMSRLKSNFLMNMNHELRTPLNGIMGYADLLTSQLVDPEQIEMTQGIYDSGMRLSETLNFILDLSKAETDTIEVIAKDVAVIPLAINSINSFSIGAAKKNLQLETIIKEENIFAHLDERLFARILYNLLDNALKFTKKGKISVEIGKELIAEKDWLYIKIKDTGIGITHDKIDLIWDEFRQVSEGLTRSYEGTGLGLTISKKAVELMQGVISVESELGVGSVFTVKFPAVNAIPQKEELITEKQAAVIQPKKETAKTAALPLALFVEDDFVNRDIVKLFLKNTCVLETAEDGEAALQLAAEKKYDLILMDINLGTGMNGIEVVKELLKMPKYAGTPIIAVSAYVTGKDKAEFLKGGGTHYLTKPFQKREILDLVKSVLKNN